MITKLYETSKRFIKENLLFLISIIVLSVICYIPIPYYIYAPGGIVNVSDRFEVENGYKSKGSFHMAYVSEYSGTIPIYLLSLIKKDWNVTKKEEIVASNETVKESNLRSKYMLDEANTDAVINAFNHAKKTVIIEKEELYVTYVDELAETELKINDQILSIDGTKVKSKKELQKRIREKEIGSKIVFEILRDKKKKKVTATVFYSDGLAKVGIMITSKRTLKTDPEVIFHFKDSESGPSGGLIMSLAIYNNLTKEDITHGLKIAGTGTIDEEGNVGEIGGIEYKIMGAEKEGVDIFFVPSGDNYKKAIKLVKERNYNIKILEATTFKDVLRQLEKNRK